MKKLEIPEHLYLYRKAEEQLAEEMETLTPVTKMTWGEGGVLLYLQGAEFPQKGMTSPEAMWAMNISKRNFIALARLLKTFPVSVGFQAVFNPKKLIKKVVMSFVDMSWRAASPFVLKEEYISSVAQELRWTSYSFLHNLDLPVEQCEKFSEIFSSMIDYDNAYRLRVSDIMTETTKEKLLKRPIREIFRLVKINKERDFIPEKFALIGYAFALLLLNRKIRRAFKDAVSEMNMRKVQLDESDKYWACIRKDYKFMGKTYEERQEMLKGKSVPVLINK